MSNSKYLDSAGTQKIVNKIRENKNTIGTHAATNMYDTEVHGLWYDDANKTLNIRNSETGEVVALAYGGGAQAPYKIMTVNIDLSNSNPETSVTYADDAVGMTPGSDKWDEFFGHYPCLFKDGAEIGKLNRNNFDQFEDGSAADISSGDAGDAMIAFPRRGLRISTVGDILTVSMTDNPEDFDFKYYAHDRGETRKDVFYLGVYAGYVQSGKMRSLKGKQIRTNEYLYDFRRYAKANGSGYENSGFYQLTFRQAMYLLKYKNLDSQTAVGIGYVSTRNSNPSSTGGTEQSGMDWGETTSMYKHMKLFGIEDFWGNSHEWIDGIYVDGECNITIATDNSYSENVTDYKNTGPYGGLITTNGLNGYISKLQGTTERGFIPLAAGGSQTTYFCDQVLAGPRNSYCFGGSWNSGYYAGVFASYSWFSSSNLVGSRLMYL